MTPAARERSQVRLPILVLSAAAWSVLMLQPASAHCSPSISVAASGWAVMLVAMMAPVLMAPVRHVRSRSFAHRRARAIALFVAGYAAIWMLAGVMMLSLAQAVRTALAEWAIPLAAAVLLVWQCSPWKQRCLNRSHAHSELAAFGLAADLGVLRFGLEHAVWCVGSCWALMLVPLMFTTGHLAAMAAVSLWLFAERLERPAPPRWQLRAAGFRKAARIAAAQTAGWNS